MSSAASPGLSATGAHRPWWRHPKIDQWICFWIVPFFFTLFGLIFVPLSWMMPPRAPDADITKIVAFMQSPYLLVACTLLTLSFGLAGIANAVYLTQMKRMSVSPVLRLALMGAAIVGTIVGMLFGMFCFGLGAFRDGYDPKVLVLLYDFGYLSFIGSLGCFCVMWMAFGLAILLDRNSVLPKWLGYYTVWQYMSEIVAAPVWIAQSGPFAWNGVMTFWLAIMLYVPWQMIIYYYIFRAIRAQPEHELENAPARRAVAGARA